MSKLIIVKSMVGIILCQPDQHTALSHMMVLQPYMKISSSHMQSAE